MILSSHHRAAIIAHAREQAPAEVCGVLAGNGCLVRRVYRLPNAAETPATRFLADPEAQLRCFLDLERRGLQVLAVYHSHPDSPARPSPTDIEMAYYPEALHIIVSLAGRRPRIKCFAIRGGEVTGETLDSRQALPETDRPTPLNQA